LKYLIGGTSITMMLVDTRSLILRQSRTATAVADLIAGDMVTISLATKIVT
jgi:hypothetical protein